MLVKHWMSTPAITVSQNDTVEKAAKFIYKNIGILPVMDKGELVGVVTDRDLKRVAPSNATASNGQALTNFIEAMEIRHMMTRNPITVPFDYTIEETAQVLLKNKISGVPVVDHDNRVIGVITQADMFRALISLTGVRKRGIQFAFRIEDRPGSIKELADVIRKYGGRMISILTTYEGVPNGYRKVHIRMRSIKRPEIKNLKEELSKIGDFLYIVDHRENKREIYEEDLA